MQVVHSMSFLKEDVLFLKLCNPNIRELFVREYRFIYSIEESRVVILGFIHGKRDLERLWEREKRKI